VRGAPQGLGQRANGRALGGELDVARLAGQIGHQLAASGGAGGVDHGRPVGEGAAPTPGPRGLRLGVRCRRKGQGRRRAGPRPSSRSLRARAVRSSGAGLPRTGRRSSDHQQAAPEGGARGLEGGAQVAHRCTEGSVHDVRAARIRGGGLGGIVADGRARARAPTCSGQRSAMNRAFGRSRRASRAARPGSRALQIDQAAAEVAEFLRDDPRQPSSALRRCRSLAPVTCAGAARDRGGGATRASRPAAIAATSAAHVVEAAL